jgi:hypothetical protein
MLILFYQKQGTQTPDKLGAKMIQVVSTVVKCRNCGRTLRSTKSITNGVGRMCAKREAQRAIVDTFPAQQIEKANEVISLGGYQKLSKVTFVVLSSDGESMYTATDETCSCKAGQYGKHVCYHRISVMLLTA